MVKIQCADIFPHIEIDAKSVVESAPIFLYKDLVWGDCYLFLSITAASATKEDEPRPKDASHHSNPFYNWQHLEDIDTDQKSSKEIARAAVHLFMQPDPRDNDLQIFEFKLEAVPGIDFPAMPRDIMLRTTQYLLPVLKSRVLTSSSLGGDISWVLGPERGISVQKRLNPESSYYSRDPVNFVFQPSFCASVTEKKAQLEDSRIEGVKDGGGRERSQGQNGRLWIRLPVASTRDDGTEMVTVVLREFQMLNFRLTTDYDMKTLWFRVGKVIGEEIWDWCRFGENEKRLVKDMMMSAIQVPYPSVRQNAIHGVQNWLDKILR